MMVIDRASHGESVTDLAEEHEIRCRTSVNEWVSNTADVRSACASRKRSNVYVGGQGRRPSFPLEDQVVG